MSLEIVGRRPIFNLRDDLYYMCEITKDMVYRIHHENGQFIGFTSYEECVSAYIKYYVTTFLNQITITLRNYDPEFHPRCYLYSEDSANYSINLFGTYLLVNNLEDVDAIVQWFIDKGNIVF